VPNITSITFTRQGLSSDADFGLCRLALPDFTVISSSIVPGTGRVTFSGIGPAQTGVWKLIVTIAPGANVGDVFNFAVVSTSDVVPASPSTTIAETFPITGSQFTIVAPPAPDGAGPIPFFFS